MADEQPHPHLVYQQPVSLLKCASRVIGFIITKSTLDIFNKFAQSEHISAEERSDTKSCIRRIAKFFDRYIPRHLHDIITQHTLQCLPPDFVEKLQPDIDGLKYLDIILRSHTKRFDMYELPYELCWTLYHSLQRLKNLQYLKLRSEDLRQNLYYITRAIKRMKKLDSFDCAYCCDEVLKVLSYNCPLTKLNINSSYDITDLSLPYILSMRNLKELNIFGCDFSLKSRFQILSGLPNLTAIYCDCLSIFLALKNDEISKMPYQSVRYFCYTPKDMINLAKYCPYIVDLHISVTELLISYPENDLSGLAALSHLKKLKVYSDASFKFTKIKPYLEARGHQLIELELSVLIENSRRTLNEIKRLCPNLQSFIVN